MKYLIYIFLITFLFSCSKEDSINKFCYQGTIFTQPGVISNISNFSNNKNTIDCIIELTDSGNSIILINISGDLYFKMNVGDSIINCSQNETNTKQSDK